MSQAQDILKAMQAGEKITPMDALNRFNCFRLESRITDIRKMGYKVEVETIASESGTRFAQYSIKSGV